MIPQKEHQQHISPFNTNAMQHVRTDSLQHSACVTEQNLVLKCCWRDVCVHVFIEHYFSMWMSQSQGYY